MITFIKGVYNYHKVGINGYIVRERINEKEGMIRVIHVTNNAIDSLISKDTGDFMFAPHNHRQDVTLYGLRGNAINVSFDFNSRLSGHGSYEYLFESELVEGKMHTHFHGLGDLDVTDVNLMGAKGLHLKYSTVHTVVAKPLAAFLIVEGELAESQNPQHKNVCYSTRPDFSLNTTSELYQPIPRFELNYMSSSFSPNIERVLRGIENQKYLVNKEM